MIKQKNDIPAGGLRRVLEALENKSGNRRHVPQFLNRVKDVVVIASSSRGGSSIFTEILRESPGLLHFRGEINPFLQLAGLTYPGSGSGSDELTASHAENLDPGRRRILEREMSLDAGSAADIDLNDPEAFSRFSDSLERRLTIQWPDIRFEPGSIRPIVEASFGKLRRDYSWEKGAFADTQIFHNVFLAGIAARYPDVDPHYYDLNPDIIAGINPGITPRQGPPSSFIIEEPPFVPISPWRPASADSAERLPLVIKTPGNAYRLEFLRRLFRGARFRVLHLARNPAASINGLYDGWRYNGFYSQKLDRRLDIRGYSDLYPAWGRSWWKFDLPPGWEDRTETRLENLCGFLWRSAHDAVLGFLESTRTESLRIPFEDIIGPVDIRVGAVSRVAGWLGVDKKPLVDAVRGELPPVMATCRPRQKRWFRKAALLAPVLADPRIRETTEKLGYEFKPEGWI